MLAVEVGSGTVKPRMILAGNGKVGSLIDNGPVRFSGPTSSPRLHSENRDREPPVPQSLRKTKAEWIRVCKFGPFSLDCQGCTRAFSPSTIPERDGRCET